MRASIKASIVAAAEKLGDTVPFWWFECCGARRSFPLYVDRGACPECREVTRRRELTSEELVMIAALAPEPPPPVEALTAEETIATHYDGELRERLR